MTAPKTVTICGGLWHVVQTACYLPAQFAGPALEWRGGGVRVIRAVYVSHDLLHVYEPGHYTETKTVHSDVVGTALELYAKKWGGK